MDPMDYAFNHPSSSEAPYHIAVPSVSPPWMTYSSGPDAGNGLDPFYLPPANTLLNPFSQDSSAYSNSYQYHLAQSDSMPWSPGFVHGSAPQDHALSRRGILPRLPTEDVDRHIARIRSSHPWDSLPTQHQQASVDARSTRESALPNSVLPPVESESCSGHHETTTTYDEALGLSAGISNQTPADPITTRGQRWSRLSHDEEVRTLRGLLPPLRSQPSFPSNDTVSGSSLPPLQPNPSSSINSRLRPTRPNHVPQTRHSISGSGEGSLPRFEETLAPFPVSPPSSFTRTGRHSPTSRSHRTSRANVLDVQRPISVSFDLGSNSRLPSTAPSTGSLSGVSSLSPRRQRTSRTGPRRHMAAPRSPSHGHGRNSIDRTLVQDFLASQNIGPADRITGYPYSMIEETMYRNLVSLQGTMGSARIARKSMVNSLLPIPVEDLPEDEKACAICYGVFGEESPEGTKEEALRLPDCNHVFGSVCLRTWLDDSDKCPYCRKKLPSEPRWFLSAARRILAMIKRPQQPGSDATDNETCLAVVRGYDRGGWLQSPPSPPPISRSTVSASPPGLINAGEPSGRGQDMEHTSAELQPNLRPLSASDLQLSSPVGVEHGHLLHLAR